MADEGSSDSPDCEGAVQKKQQEKGKAFIQNLKKVIPYNSTITEDMDCSTASLNALNELSKLHKKYGEKVLSQEMLIMLKNHRRNKEAVLCFYGTSNCGKSTILNSILGAKYLPMNVTNETAVPVKIMFKCFKEDMEPNPTMKCQLNINGNKKKLTPTEVCTHLRKKNSELRDNAESNECQCILNIENPVKCIGKGAENVVFLDTPGLDEFGSENISRYVAMVENMSSAFVIVTTFADYKKDKLSGMLQELYQKDKGILSDNRLTIVINKIDEALKEGDDEDEPCHTKGSVIRDVRNYFCTKVFKCNLWEMPEKCIILLCSSWSLYVRTFKKFEPKLVLKLCETTLLGEDSKKSLREEPDEMKQNKVLEDNSNILELESRLKEISATSWLLWENKLSSDMWKILSQAEGNLHKLMSVKEKECEELQSTIQVYTAAFQKYATFCKEVNANYKKAKKKSLPQDAAIVKVFRDAFNEDMKNSDLETVMLEDVSQALSAFNYDIQAKIDSKSCSPLKFKSELEKTVNRLFETLAVRMNNSKCLSKAFSKESKRISADINDLASNFFNIVFITNILNTELVVATPDVPIPYLKSKVRIPLKLKWWQEIIQFFGWYKEQMDSEKLNVEMSNSTKEQHEDTSKPCDYEDPDVVKEEQLEDTPENLLALDTIDILPEQENLSEAESDLALDHFNHAEHVDGEGSASTIEEEEDILDAGNVDFTVTEDDTANSRASPVVIAALNEDQTESDIKELHDDNHEQEPKETTSDTTSLSSDKATALESNLFQTISVSKDLQDGERSSGEESAETSKRETSLTRPYKKWTPRMNQILRKIREDFTGQITKYFKETDTIIMQCCIQYYKTALRILIEFKRKNYHIISQYGRKFTEAKMRNKKVEKEKKDIESDIEIVKGIHSKLTLIFQKSSK